MAKGKTVAIVLGVCAGVGVLAIGACAGLLYWGYRNADANVSPRIDALLAAIDHGTFAETYDTETTQELRNAASKEQYANIGKAIATRLGRLKTKSLRAFNMRQFNAGSFVDVTYAATFEKGTGTITARMKRQGGQWKFVSFRVDSPVFLQDLATATCAKCGAPHSPDARFCPACGEKTASDDKSTGHAQDQKPTQ